MTKTAKFAGVLAGIVVLAVLAISLSGRQQSAGALNRVRDNLLYLLGIRKHAFSKCIDNLHRIEGAKIMWANENAKTTNDVPTWNDLRDYLADQRLNGIPTCQSGGTYKLNRVGVRPTCSIGGAEHSSQ